MILYYSISMSYYNTDDLEDIKMINLNQWKILWTGKRPIDKKVYYVIKRR